MPLAGIDLLIIAAYILFICWRGIRARTSYHTADDYFLANRSLSWPVIGLSLFATNISTSSIIGLGGSGYKTGISVFNYEWTGGIMLVFFALFIVPYYIQNRLTTMPEFLERRFDHRSRLYFSIISILINVLIDIAGALYAGSLFLRGLFPDIDLFVFVGIMAFIAGLYTVVGGLKAVVITDSVQGILLALGTGIISVTLFMKLGSWGEIQAALPENFLSLIQPMDDPLVPWPTLFVSLPILGFYFMCSNQHMVQRILGARSVEDGKKGAIFAGFLKIPILFILVLPGTMGLLLYPNLENANLIFPTMLYDLLPAGLLGIVITGFIAALMSSIDSALTASGSIATLDIYKKMTSPRSERHFILVGKAFIIIFVSIASLWAPFIEQFPTLWEYLQAVLAYLAPPVVVCFLFGLFWKRASADGAFYTLGLGSLFALLTVINNYLYPVFGTIHYLYSATLIFLFSSIVMLLVSLLSPRAQEPARENALGTIAETRQQLSHSATSLQTGYFSSKEFAFFVCMSTLVLVIIFW
ncbi:sodium:solute symporter [Fodinibius sediminis]|uniref:Solute:Na+ symporter, SSS family n=1 Tax=Fodinibius sediminis TaxID=1214077 RepID=A0A521CVR1_9BACT|nr:sodium:solute symporter [Fodinibius sediminis]SMO63534.1 solute:Na+ symporter, SSS family [Fodinibius sediminis]